MHPPEPAATAPAHESQTPGGPRLAGLLLVLGCVVPSLAGPRAAGERLDPAAWGSDHVGKPLPEYVTGDECLFCHRTDVGPGWGANRHNLTVRRIDPASAALAALQQAPALKELSTQVELVLGGRRQVRFLRPAQAYGKLELLSTAWEPGADGKAGRLLGAEQPHWQPGRFAESCAGCHATAVDAATQAFSALGIECYSCHGVVDPMHSRDPALVHLAKKRRDPPRVVTSICAQCHLRTGTARSTGRPYPTHFVAGDNLFRDFQVDLSDQHIREVGPADGHILANVRDVVVEGNEAVTCLSCHDVHRSSSRKHHRVAESSLCLHCHHSDRPKRDIKPTTVHSRTCGY